MVPLAYPASGHERWFAMKIDSHGTIAFSSDSNRTAIMNGGGTGRILQLPAGWLPGGGMNDASQLTFTTLTAPLCDEHGSCNSQCGTVAYVWDFSANRIVATLAPRESTTNAPLSICPWELNNAGMVSGSVFTVIQSPRDSTHENGFRWSPQRGFEYAPSFGSGVTAEPSRMNEAGDVTLYLFSYIHVGSDSVSDLSSAVWMADGRVIRLGSMGGDHTAANGINDAHVVVGHTQVGSSTGRQQAVLWDLTTASQSRVAPSATVVQSSARQGTADAGGAPEPAWKRNTARHWSRMRQP
jgi:hypothetical protein